MLSEEVYKYPKPEVTFERAVAWLLSLGGFHTINLESKKIKSFDKVHVGAVEIGCADILAYKENDRLLLVDCTIRTPNAQKIQDLKDAKKHVSSILASYKGLRVVPLIFSPADCSHVETDVEVRIIDKYQIKEILGKIARGQVEDIQHMFYDFRKIAWRVPHKPKCLQGLTTNNFPRFLNALKREIDKSTNALK